MIDVIVTCCVPRWKVSNVTASLESIMASCGPELRGLGLGGWSGLRGEHLEALAKRCPKLRRIDLSSINVSTPHYVMHVGEFCVHHENS